MAEPGCKVIARLSAPTAWYEPELAYEGDYRIDSGHKAGPSLLPHRLDAVFVANYLMTVGWVGFLQTGTGPALSGGFRSGDAG
jgi:DNA-binding LacI/PurR family transcriptional regulator